MLQITAPRSFHPFEDICILEPFVERLSREFKDVACESCFMRIPKLKSCKSCLNVKYCGKVCQKKDWKNHKLECQKLKNLDEGIADADIIRLLGNTILKIKGKDWKSIKSKILEMDVSFDDFDETMDIDDAYQDVYYNLTKKSCKRYIGDENMPNDEEFKKILGKVRNSKFYNTTDDVLSVKTCKVLFGLSLFDVNCIPNCVIIRRNNINIIKALKKIEKSEKLSVRRNPLFAVLNIPGLHSRCNCADCRLPYGESVLSKITNEQNAIEVIFSTQLFINMWERYGQIFSMPFAEYLLDNLLEKHDGVLGDTNLLHLKLLAIKCFETESDPFEKKKYLLKLEKSIVAVFGEYYPSLIRVYNALAENCFLLGNIRGKNLYLDKATLLLDIFS